MVYLYFLGMVALVYPYLCIKLHKNTEPVAPLLCNTKIRQGLSDRKTYHFSLRMDWKERSRLLLGEEIIERFSHCHVLVVGVGGVGAYAAEMLVRAGIGEITIVDADTVNVSNINRQLVALHSTVGQPKTKVLERRLTDINNELKIHTYTEFLKDERTSELLEMCKYDYVVDAIDTLSPKVFLIQKAVELGLPIISSMGAGAKRDITQIRLSNIWETYNCALSRAVRKRLTKMGVKKKIPCVFSTETADPKAVLLINDEENKVSTVGTVSYMPATFGNFIACHVIKELSKKP